MNVETMFSLRGIYDDYECVDSNIGIVVKKDDKVGVVDKHLNIIIPLIYETLYLVEFDTKRMIAQLDSVWLVIDEENNILFKSSRNYQSCPE